METIICSAIWLKDVERAAHRPINTPGGIVVCGFRHNHCIAVVAALTGKKLYEFGEHVQGFLTSRNRFLDRVEAGKLAILSGQIEKLEYSETELFSEDIF
jgi:hypothetical protein